MTDAGQDWLNAKELDAIVRMADPAGKFSRVLYIGKAVIVNELAGQGPRTKLQSTNNIQIQNTNVRNARGLRFEIRSFLF